MSAAKPPKVPGRKGEVSTVAHRLDHIAANIVHTRRHIDAVKEDPKAAKANADHAAHHADETADQVAKLIPLLAKKIPGVGAELKKLDHMGGKIRGTRSAGR